MLCHILPLLSKLRIFNFSTKFTVSIPKHVSWEKKPNLTLNKILYKIKQIRVNLLPTTFQTPEIQFHIVKHISLKKVENFW